MFPYWFRRFAAVFALLLVAVSVAHAAPARRGASSWARIGLRHVSAEYVLDALRQGRDWRAMLDARRHSRSGGGALVGVASVVPSRRDNSLLVRGTHDGLRQLRELVALLDTTTGAARASGPAGNVTQAYEMALANDWPRSLTAAEAVLSRDPANAQATALKAYALVKCDQPDMARPLVTKALRQTEGKTGRARGLALIAEGALQQSHGDGRGAVQTFQQAGNADGTLGLTYIAFANAVRESGKSNSAKTLLQQGLSRAGTPAEQAAIRARLGASR